MSFKVYYKKTMESYKNLGCIIRKRNLLAHVSIWTLVAIVLTISLTVFTNTLIGIIYLLFFLTFVLIFQSSFSLWARIIKCYCVLLVLYSTSVSVLTYSFQYSAVNEFYKELLTEDMLNDVGLVVRNQTWLLFLEPIIPLTLAILLVIYLRVFHDDFKRFAYLAEENDTSLSTPLTDSQAGAHQTINDSTFIMLNTSNSLNQDSNIQDRPSKAPSTSTLAKNDLKRTLRQARFRKFISAATECFWRILETHFVKLVAFMIFRLAVVDICLLNLPFLIIIIFALKYPSTAKCSCMTASWLIAFIVVIRNLSNLKTLRHYDITSTCGANAPQPLVGQTYSFLEYIGLNNSPGSPLNRVDDHILVLVLITMFSFICIHYERRSVKDYELSFGVIFTGVGRREAESGIINTLKYFCNFGFYKFGIEVTCLALIIAISNRLDSTAAIYGIILILLSITTTKRTLASIWSVLSIIICLLIPIQYVLRLGFPRVFCEPYPWASLPDDFKYWLFLPDYSITPDARLLLYDFLVLLAICRQGAVFKLMRQNSNPSFITNCELRHDFSAQQFRVKYLPSEDEFAAEDCFSNYTTQANYLKSIFFKSIYWITLAVVLLAGATKISLFSLGYLIGCFIFLWLGNDAYLMPLKRLVFNWNWFIFYATLVIFIKVVLQLYTCFLHEYLLNHCYILQILRVVCYRKLSVSSTDSTNQNLCIASLPYDELDILWDGVCLMFLLMQRVVFGSQYFSYLVQEVKAQQILASRGAELIMATQIEEAKAHAFYEREVMKRIREKLDNLKSDDSRETAKAWQRLLAFPHHHQIIRNANRHLFSAILDDPVSQIRSDDWKFKRAFIPDPIGDELERMNEINGISAVFTRWMKGKPLYGNGSDSGDDTYSPEPEPEPQEASTEVEPSPEQQPSKTDGKEFVSIDKERDDDIDTERKSKADDDMMSMSDDLGDGESGKTGRIRDCWDMLNLIVYSILLSATVELNKLSRSYRYVSRRMAVEKTILKRQFNLDDERFRRDPNWRKWVIGTLSDTYTKTNEEQGGLSNTSLNRIRSALKVISSNNAGSSQESNQSTESNKSPTSSQKPHNKTELTDPEYYFLKLNMFTQFCRALAYVFVSNTSLICQLIIILNQVLTASLLSLPLPLLTFLWGTLSVPRPTKRFWKTVITYTEIVIVIKYIFQFPIWDFEMSNLNPFYYPNLLGIKNITLLYDLFLLLALFFHRSMLKSLGQWYGSNQQEESASVVATREEPKDATESQEQNIITFEKEQIKPEPRFVKSYQLQENLDRSIELAPRVAASVELDRTLAYEDYSNNLYQNQVQEIEIDSQNLNEDDNQNGPPSTSRSCCVRAYHRTKKSILSFFQHVLNTPHKVETDVYTWMFICDFVNILILIYGFWAFGSGYTNQTVASFFGENRIPFSVLILLLAAIIMDRSFYLQKNIARKLIFHIIVVIGIHFWLFFALPFTTGHTLTLKEYWLPKAWYIFKCLYFLLSAHQIRSGYPRRVLGNCFTKGFGLANWTSFKVYRAIPLVYDLRLYMDWIWTETTLEFRNWSLMEDMYANLFIRKCELTFEAEYPSPRAKPLRRLPKYIYGGTFILLILAIIWGPLLFFSSGKTVGESNLPVEMEFELEFVGFQPILRLRATAQQIITINENQYNLLKSRFASLRSQGFLGDYKVGDVTAIRLEGQSNAVWEISPPSKELLMNNIKNNDTLILKSTWTLYRINKGKSQSIDVNIAGSHQDVINANSSQEFRKSLLDMLNESSTTQTPANNIKFVITPPIFPNFVRVPETGVVSLVEFKDNVPEYQPLRPLNLTYIRMYDTSLNQTDNSTSWWKADDLCKYNPSNDSYPFWPPTILDHCDSLVLVAFNDRIFTGIFAFLSAQGIIGLYTTVVVFFARLIRSEPAGKVIYTEIPKVDRVYGLVMDIYMMRECGEFELEEKLFAKLLYLYRSPEMLIEWSK